MMIARPAHQLCRPLQCTNRNFELYPINLSFAKQPQCQDRNNHLQAPRPRSRANFHFGTSFTRSRSASVICKHSFRIALRKEPVGSGAVENIENISRLGLPSPHTSHATSIWTQTNSRRILNAVCWSIVMLERRCDEEIRVELLKTQRNCSTTQSCGMSESDDILPS